jgi:hypothetical protein
VPEAVQVIESPGDPLAASVVPGQDTVTPDSLSVTATDVKGTLPVFVTTYVQLTVLPTATSGPGGRLASTPFVRLTMSIPPAMPK